MMLQSRTITDLLTTLQGAQVIGNTEVSLSGITMDSRKVSPGDLYVCIPGLKADGHDFAASACNSGAVALLVERFLPLAIPQIKVDNTRKRVGQVAAFLYGEPSSKLHLVGVTGTNGKTTVTHLVERIAHVGGLKTGIIGTLGTRILQREIPGQHTTPESTDIQRLLRDMVEENIRLVAMEVSSHALDLGRVEGCRYQAAIFTNLSQDHLDYHQTMEEYLKAKALLFAGMGQDSDQFVVLNKDDKAYAFLREQAACRVVTYGFDQGSDYQASGLQLLEEGVAFQVSYQGQQAEVFYATPGKFSVYNALAAFAWGIEAGYSPEQLVQALGEKKGVPGRFESLRQGQPFLVIVDYAHTPDGLENVLLTAREITKGRLITLFGCGGDRDRTKRPKMGEVAARLSDEVIVTSDNPRTEDPYAIIQDILPGLGSCAYRVIVDRRSAIAQACSQALPGDTVMIAGKGHEDYQIIGTEKIHFDDREEAQTVLRGLGYVGQ